MNQTHVPQSFRRPSALAKIAALAGGLLFTANLAVAEPVNLIYFPLTNVPSALVTNFSSDTSLGGVSLVVSNYNSNGIPVSFGGLAGSAVNGVAIPGVAAMCLTNSQGQTQPGNSTNPAAGQVANNSCDLGDPNLAFGNITNFVVTFWFNQPVKAPSGGGFQLPRMFVLGTGGSPGLNDGSANSIGVKFQQANQFIFSVNTATLTTTYASDLTTNKWFFVAWAYDGTNLLQYTGSDTAAATLQNSFAIGAQTVTLGNPSTLVVGNRNFKGGRGFNGWMEDFRFYRGFSTNNLNFVENIRKQIAPKIPTITGVYPDGSSLLQATNTLVFTAQSSSGFNLANIDLKVNSVDVSSSCTFVTNGTPGTSTNVSVSYPNLPQQQTVTAVMTATDGIGLVGSSTVSFDTFSPTNFIVKAEEFDYNSGLFLDNPVYTNVAEGDSYFSLGSVEGIDTHKGQSTGDNMATAYRADDGTGLMTQTPLSTDLPSPTRFGGNIVPSHMIGNWSSAEWQNYTKTFPPGPYNVYARLSTSSGSTVTFDQVTAGQTTANQSLSRLGSFTFTGSGAFQWVPLRQFGSLAVLNLSGVKTVRTTTGGGANANFYMFVPANTSLPTISGVYPDGQFLFEVTNKLAFTVSSSITTISTNNVVVTLNGNNVSSNLVFSGGPSTWNVIYPGLQTNQTYNVVINVTDNNSASANATLTIDTWNPVFQVEAEAFDFDPTLSIVPGTGKRYIDNSVSTAPLVPAANSYEGQTGIIGIDEAGNIKTNVSPIQAGFAGATFSNYRTNDPCATAPITDAARTQFTGGALDYNIGFLGPGHWENYTRTWPSGTFNAYARMASGANLGTLYSSWSTVIAGWGTTNQITKHLGSFALPSTGGYSSYLYTPLMDRFGNIAQLTLGGTNTIRDTHLVFNQTETANGAVFGMNINFYMLLNARADQARIDNVYPDGSMPMQATNTMTFVASSPTYGINTTNVHLTLNGVDVSSGLAFSGGPSTWNVSYPGLQPDSSYSATITVTDNNNQTHVTTLTFDTFSTNNFTWEAEDFDFDPGSSPIPTGNDHRFIDNPAPTSVPAITSYFGQTGASGVDYSATFINVIPIPLVYRTGDLVPMLVTSDVLRPRTLNAQLAQDNPFIQDYDIFNLTNNAPGPTFINYTRTFPAGNYYVRARMLAATAPTNCLLTQLVGSTSNVLGSFQATAGSWQYASLIDRNTGLPAIVSLGNGPAATNTVQLLGEGFERVNFFMFVPLPQFNVSAKVSGANVLVSFPTQSGHTYVVSWRNDLTDSVWTPLGTAVTGNGLVQTVTDPLGPGHRFYKVTVQ